MENMDMEINPGDQLGPSTNTTVHSGRPTEICGDVMGQLAGPYFGPVRGMAPPKLRLTMSRKKWIQEYKDLSSDQVPMFGAVGSGPWVSQLVVYLKSKDRLVEDVDVYRWCNAHPWICKSAYPLPPPPAPAPAPATLLIPPPPPESGGPESVENSSDRNIVSSSFSAPLLAEDDPKKKRQKEEEARLKGYFEVQLQLKRLKDFVGEDPALRAHVQALDGLNRAVARAVLNISGKTRVELLHEELEAAGIPHVPRGMKREIILSQQVYSQAAAGRNNNFHPSGSTILFEETILPSETEDEEMSMSS